MAQEAFSNWVIKGSNIVYMYGSDHPLDIPSLSTDLGLGVQRGAGVMPASSNLIFQES